MNPITLLCFGDSNTWGYHPDDKSRYSRDCRYTGILQKRLGEQFLVIEEGLCGRTSGFTDGIKPYTNAMDYIIPCLLSHSPLDCVIVMLGTNELKTRFDSTPEEIAHSIQTLLKKIKQTLTATLQKPTKILLIAPASVDERIIVDPEFDISAVARSKKLPFLLDELAKKEHVEFLNADESNLLLGEDGCHLTEQAHQKLADAIYERILFMFPPIPA